MTLFSTSGSLGHPHYITLIDNKPIVEMWVTWLMTWLEMTWHDNDGTFVLLLECMSNYSDAGWWMSPWCNITSRPHGEVRGVFDGPSFAWWIFSMLFLAFMLEGLIGSSIREGACFPCSSTSQVSSIHPLVRLSFCMYSLRSFHSSSCSRDRLCLCIRCYCYNSCMNDYFDV